MLASWTTSITKTIQQRANGKKKADSHTTELRIATSGSFSIRASIESLRVEGASSYTQPRVRAALLVPSTVTTVQFFGDGCKKPGPNTRSSCVHVLQMFTPAETHSILSDAMNIGTCMGWSDRGVSLPTQDVLVQNLSKESQELVHRAIRQQLLPFARRQYPHLNAAFDKQPYPRPGNLFIVRYSAASQRPGGRGLKMHKDETALTFNLCLSPQVCERGRARTRACNTLSRTHARTRTHATHPLHLASFSSTRLSHPSHTHTILLYPPFLASALSQDGFEGGGTYFPAASGDVDGILLRPTPGYCLVHDGYIKHAGNEVTSGDRYILVGFYNADGRDRAGEEAFFNKKALEEERQRSSAACRRRRRPFLYDRRRRRAAARAAPPSRRHSTCCSRPRATPRPTIVCAARRAADAADANRARARDTDRRGARPGATGSAPDGGQGLWRPLQLLDVRCRRLELRGCALAYGLGRVPS